MQHDVCQTLLEGKDSGSVGYRAGTREFLKRGLSVSMEEVEGNYDSGSQAKDEDRTREYYYN